MHRNLSISLTNTVQKREKREAAIGKSYASSLFYSLYAFEAKFYYHFDIQKVYISIRACPYIHFLIILCSIVCIVAFCASSAVIKSDLPASSPLIK